MKKEELIVVNKIILNGEKNDSFRGLYKITNVEIPRRNNKGIYFKYISDKIMQVTNKIWNHIDSLIYLKSDTRKEKTI